MRQLVDDVVMWGVGKQLVPGDPVRQALKMVSEVGEFADEVLKGDKAKQTGELGDILVTCIITGATLGIDVQDALQVAYDKISKRKGTTVGGIFIKETT